jgi:predicted transposase/invertase (TIGR01784 family)
MVPIGIRPTNDYAFKKTFGSPANKLALVSLLNAILDLRHPIVDVTIENPFNLQDFHDDKLSILDIRAVDERGAIYDIEMQLSIFSGLVKRIVFYGCEVYAGQLKTGDDYKDLKPVYSICLLEGRLWHDSGKVHHAFRLADRDSGRVLEETLEIHTLELGWYNLTEDELGTASVLDLWLFWLLHAHEYDTETLDRLFPLPAFRQATETITRIAKITEDKTMYDTREKAIRDRQWAFNAVREEGREEGLEQGREEGLEQGREEGEIKLIQTLQEVLGLPVSNSANFEGQSLADLRKLTAELRSKIQRRS